MKLVIVVVTVVITWSWHVIIIRLLHPSTTCATRYVILLSFVLVVLAVVFAVVVTFPLLIRRFEK